MRVQISGLQSSGALQGKATCMVVTWSLSAAVRKLTLIGCDELLTAKVDVILTIGYPAALAARQGTTTIPIVVTEPGGDPIATGSLMGSRPIYRFSRATKVELVLNLKTAKLLRLDVPPALVARADEVIE